MNAPSRASESRRASPDRRGPYLLVAAVALAVFFPGVFGEFVYDDHRFIERNAAIRSLGNVLDFVLDPRTCSEESWEGIYRPLRTLSFAVDHALWGLDPLGYHLQSLLWHILASLGLLALLGRLGLGRGPSTLAALLFAVHPVHAESVSWVTSRSDVMSGALVFITLAIHAGRPSTRRRRRAVLALAVLAMLAKESAVVLAPLIVLLDLTLLKPWDAPEPGPADRRTRLRAHARRCWVPLAVAVVLYIAIRQWRTAVYATADQFGHLEVWWGGSYLGQLAVASRGFLLSVLALVWPLGPRLDYYPAVDARIDAPVMLAWTLLAILLIVAVRSYRRHPLVTVGLLWFLLTMSPTSNLLFTVGIPSADRFLYVPLAGVLLALAPALRHARRAPVFAAIVALGVLAIHVSQTFRSEDELWRRAPASSPRRLIHVARLEYEEVLRLWDDDLRENAVLGIPGALDAGHTAIRRMAEIFETKGTLPLVHTYMQIANLHRLRGEYQEAYRYLKLAGKAHHHHPKTSYLMALLYEDVGDPAGARAEFLLARKRKFLDPLGEDIARALNEEARSAQEDGSYGAALALWEWSRNEWPERAGNIGIGERIALVERERRQVREREAPAGDDLEGWYLRGIASGQVGLWRKAVGILGRLHRADPARPEITLALARWGYEESGEFVKAAELYEAVLERDPVNQEAKLGLLRCGALARPDALRVDPAERLAFLASLPGTPAVLVLRARALRELGRHEEARARLDRAASGRGPGVVDAIHMLWQDEIRSPSE